ncbi:pyruvate dehydrogenase (acetyl-transferring) E1 component subunit alpha [Immundisolibacter sp.]|uniref:pyruvate dehydrogenase (acetyl-transferring) E1 component subunit alpha n=1 Tax=Immundisolibacter sp. TaxID=1934948 RepID=UPI003569CD90
MKTTVARFSVAHHQLIDERGQALGRLPRISAAALRRLYGWMVLTRRFDERAVRLQRTGQLGTYASSLGHEALHVGLADAMRADDVLLPTYREAGALMVRGVAMQELLRYWGGDERGSDFAGPRRDFPYCVPIATQCTHAAGVASAMRLRGEKRVAVCCLGDGASSKGDFYEALNLAGVWRLPLVFVISNNQWAISVPLSKQTACATLAQKAVAGGVPGEQVDGNDALAVRQVMGRALARARRGDGPTLVEGLTYRLGDHTTSDDARRYRPEAEVSAAWKRDPLPRQRQFMAGQGLWSAADEERLISDCDAQVERAVAAYLATPAQDPTDMFDYLHAQLPTSLAGQRADVAGAAHG